jgi:hypothetical protein
MPVWGVVQVLGIHAFDATRKRMSMVVRCPDGQTLLLIKVLPHLPFFTFVCPRPLPSSLRTAPRARSWWDGVVTSPVPPAHPVSFGE